MLRAREDDSCKAAAPASHRDGGATRVSVLVYGSYSEVGRDVEVWFAGGAQCFERYRSSL